MNYYIVLVIFLLTELVLTYLRNRKTSSEIREALGERDTLIQVLRDEMNDRITNTANMVGLAQKAACESEVAAANALMRAESAEGAAKRGVIDGDLTLNLGEKGSLKVGESILGHQNLILQGTARRIDIIENSTKMAGRIKDVRKDLDRLKDDTGTVQAIRELRTRLDSMEDILFPKDEETEETVENREPLLRRLFRKDA